MRSSLIHKRYDGLKYQIYPYDKSEFVGICIFVEFGAFNETVWKYKNNNYSIKSGSAHFLEHLIYKKIILNEEINFGYDSFACTSLIGTYYQFICKDNNYEKLLKIIFQSLNELETSEYIFNNEKEIIKDEILQRNTSMNVIAMDELRFSLFGKSNLSNSITGTLEELSNITIDDLINSFNLFYTPKNISLSIAGNLDVDRVYKIMKTAFSNKENIDLEINKLECKTEVYLKERKINTKHNKQCYYIGFIDECNNMSIEDNLLTKISLDIIYNIITMKDYYNNKIMSWGYSFGRSFAYTYLSVEHSDIDVFINNILSELNNLNYKFFNESKSKIINQFKEIEESVGNRIYISSWLTSMDVKIEDYFNIANIITENDLKHIIKKCFKKSNIAYIKIN